MESGNDHYGGRELSRARMEPTTTCRLLPDLPIYGQKESQDDLDLNSLRPYLHAIHLVHVGLIIIQMKQRIRMSTKGEWWNGRNLPTDLHSNSQ